LSTYTPLQGLFWLRGGLGPMGPPFGTCLYVTDLTDVFFNGTELGNKLLKPMKKLQNFHFYVELDESKSLGKSVEQILSTFLTFPWPIGVHENGSLCSLPFPFHELKHFRHFQDVRLNNTTILKDDHRLWFKVRSLQLVHSDEIDFESLFSLIKLNMPKLSSITLRGKNGYNSLDDTDNCDEIERVRVQLDSVTTKLFALKKCQEKQLNK
jgi:hypothetical protein